LEHQNKNLASLLKVEMQKQRDLKEEVKSCENAMALFVNTLNKVSLKLIIPFILAYQNINF